MNKEEIVIQLRNLYFKVEEATVQSTNVDKVKYNTVSKEMKVKFDDGSVYTYYNVPERIYDNVREGLAGTKTAGPWGPVGKYTSVGAAVHQYLIKGKFKYKKGGPF